MNRALRALILLGLLGAVGGPIAAADAASVPPVGKAFGFSDNSMMFLDGPGYLVSPTEEADWAHDAGANSHRLVFSWAKYEGQTPGLWNLDYQRRLDSFVTAWKSAGPARGHLVMTLGIGAPGWAAVCPSCKNSAPRLDKLAYWARYVRVAASHYRDVQAFEIWNEPNGDWAWAPKADAVAYAQFLKTAYTAIKSVRPDAKVILGGLSSAVYDDAIARSMTSYMNDLYANGVLGHYDALGVHPYPRQDGGVFEGTGSSGMTAGTLDRLRAVRDTHDPGARLWATEVGVTTGGPDALSRIAQADAAEQLYDFILGQPDVDAVFFHKLFDDEDRPEGARGAGYGFVNADPFLLSGPKAKRTYCRFYQRAGTSRRRMGCL